ncbi:MAG: Na+/H+ antiporter subunit E [Vicinamibacterales bacterium]
MRRLATVAVLDGIYLTALGSASLADAALGAAFAAVFTGWASAHLGEHTARARGTRVSWISRLLWLAPFVAVVLYDAARNGIRALRSLLAADHQSGLVEVPVAERTPLGVAVTALCTTLSPGSVFLELDPTRRVMVFHYVDAADPDQIRASHARFYERIQRRVFP